MTFPIYIWPTIEVERGTTQKKKGLQNTTTYNTIYTK